MTDNSLSQERHILVVNDGKRRVIALEAAAYSVGRDPSNAIVLNVDTISRQHAIFLRVPAPGVKQYRYRVIDGNSQGKPSANGVFINGQQCRSNDLQNGDLLRFGHTVDASYLTVSMGEAEFLNYLESIAYQSIKSDTINAKETLVAACLTEEDITSVTTLPPKISEKRQRSSAIPWAETVNDQPPATVIINYPYRLWMVAIPSVLALVGVVVGVGLLISHNPKPSQSSATPIQQPASSSQPTQPAK